MEIVLFIGTGIIIGIVLIGVIRVTLVAFREEQCINGRKKSE